MTSTDADPPAGVRRTVAVGGLRGFARSRVGGLPKTFWVLWSGTLVNRLGTFVEPFLILYLTRQRGMSVAGAGGVLTVFGAGGLFSQPVGGMLADRHGRRATLSAAMLAASAAMLLLGAARTTLLITLAAFLVGLTVDLYRPASQALVADSVSPADRTRAYGLLFWAVNLGWAAATTLAGYLAERGYLLLFLGDAATSLVFGLVIWRGVARVSSPDGTGTGHRGGFGQVWRDRTFVTLAAFQLGYAVVFFQLFVTLPLAVRSAGLSPADYGLVAAVNGVVIVVVQPLVVGWLGRLPRSATLAGAQLLVGVGFALTGLASSLPQFAAVVAVWTLGEIGVTAVGSSLVAELAGPQLRGRYFGLYGLAYGVAAVLAPALGTGIYAGLGPAVLWWGCAVIGVGLATGQLLLAPAVRRRLSARCS